jgi:hypothetical protein
MAQATLQEMAREVHLYSSGVCPILLAERWVRDRYRSVCEKTIWSFKLGRSAFASTDAYSTGTITLTNASATVTGSSTVWVAAHVGQQLKVSGYVFTISAVGSNTSCTIDQTWLGATTASLTYEILQAYITPSPTDFHAFYSVIDPGNSWIIRLGYNVKDLDRWDTRRSSSGTPRILANGVYNSSNASVYELWPHPSTIRQYMYTYEKSMDDLTSTSTPPNVIGSDLLVTGALADLARWPGTPERKNPLYDPYFNQWKIRESEFNEGIQRAIVEDQSIFMTDLSYNQHLNLAPLDAKFRQNHAF